MLKFTFNKKLFGGFRPLDSAEYRLAGDPPSIDPIHPEE